MIILPARRSRVKAKQIAHERSECRQANYGGLIKCQNPNKPPYNIFYFISGGIKRIFYWIKISLFTMQLHSVSFSEVMRCFLGSPSSFLFPFPPLTLDQVLSRWPNGWRITYFHHLRLICKNTFLSITIQFCKYLRKSPSYPV